VWWTDALRVLFDVLYDDECMCLCGGQVL